MVRAGAALDGDETTDAGDRAAALQGMTIEFDETEDDYSMTPDTEPDELSTPEATDPGDPRGNREYVLSTPTMPSSSTWMG